jgi:aspartyl-tRNA(Asn)/glutamyl-tRNA(Gln) amidotransferase subunit B
MFSNRSRVRGINWHKTFQAESEAFLAITGPSKIMVGMSSLAEVAVTPELRAKYEVVIGLEVHVQLASRTKIYCSCPANFGSDPNTNVCPTCLALPGALPVLNRKVVEYGVKAGLALHCGINPASVFARKNYFYPDSPKGFQLSQFDKPVAEHGYVDITTEKGTKRIGVTRAHLEDDAGKSVHDGFRDSAQYTYVDLNRSGTPLIEIVSEPDMRSADEAEAYAQALKQMMEYAGVSTCDMEKGHLRFDANVSVRPWGQAEFGTRAEVKNLNSFKFLKLAIDFEVDRQIAIVEGGGKVRQETRGFSPATGETSTLRDKENAHDYRYFPEPDLLPLAISDAQLAAWKAELPEMPADKRARFVSELGLREYDAEVLTASRELGAYFEEVATASGDARTACNWVMGDLLGALKAEGKEITESPVSAARLGELLKILASGEISGKIAKDVFAKMLATGDAAGAIIEREGLKQISDSGAIEKIVDEVIAASPKQVEQYKGGKRTVAAYFVGQVMKLSKGQANPAAVQEILKAKLG